MKKVIAVCILTGLTNIFVQAQQLAQYSQYMLNQYVLNPAVAGTTDYAHIVTSYRNQWSGAFDNSAPITYYVSGYTSLGRNVKKPHPFRNKHAGYHSIGGVAYNDQTGPTGTTGFLGSYTYNLRMSGSWRFSMGASLGAKQYSLNGNQLTFAQTEVVNSRKQWVPDGNIGIWLYNKYFFFGASAAQLFQSKLNFDIPAGPASTTQVSKLTDHYFVTSGIKLEASDELDIIPSFLFRYDNPAPASIDFNVKARYKNMIWVGTSYRTVGAVVFLCGFMLNNQFEFGYSYDMTVSKLQNYVGGSHEIMLAYRMWSKAGIRNPSDFW